MKFELKRISYNSRLSQETAAFAADVWWNGKKAGEASNAGHGGGTVVHLRLLSLTERFEIDEWIAAQPRKVYPASGGSDELSVPLSLDVIVDDLLEAYLAEKYGEGAQKKKWCKKDVVFRLKGDKPGAYRTIRRIRASTPSG